MDLVRQIKDGSKGFLIADLSGFNWRLEMGKVKVKKNKVNRTDRSNRSRSKSLEVDRSQSKSEKKCKSSIDFDRFDNHFDRLRLIRPITSIDFD